MALISSIHLVSGSFNSFDNGGSHTFNTDQLTCQVATVSTRAGVESVSNYQIRGSEVYVKVNYPASGDTRIIVEVVDANNNAYFFWLEGNIIYKRRVAGSEADITFSGYSGTNDKWWKIKEASNIISFHTAADSGGVPGSFTQKASEDWTANNGSWNPDAVKLRLYSVHWINDNNSMDFFLLNGANSVGGAKKRYYATNILHQG